MEEKEAQCSFQNYFRLLFDRIFSCLIEFKTSPIQIYMWSVKHRLIFFPGEG